MTFQQRFPTPQGGQYPPPAPPQGNGYYDEGYDQNANIYDGYGDQGANYYDNYGGNPYSDAQGSNNGSYYGAAESWDGEYSHGGYPPNPPRGGGHRGQPPPPQHGSYGRGGPPPHSAGPPPHQQRPPPRGGRRGPPDDRWRGAPPMGRPPRGGPAYPRGGPDMNNGYPEPDPYSPPPGPESRRGPPNAGYDAPYDEYRPQGREGQYPRGPPPSRGYDEYGNGSRGGYGPGPDDRRKQRPPQDDRGYEQRPGTSSGGYPPGPGRGFPIRSRTEPSTPVDGMPPHPPPLRRGFTTHEAPDHDHNRDYGSSRPNTAPAPEPSRMRSPPPMAGAMPPYPPDPRPGYPQQRAEAPNQYPPYGSPVASPVEEMPAFDMPRPPPPNIRPPARGGYGNQPSSPAYGPGQPGPTSPTGYRAGSQRRPDPNAPYPPSGRPSQDSHPRELPAPRAPGEGQPRSSMDQAKPAGSDRPTPVRPGLMQNNLSSQSGRTSSDRSAAANGPSKPTVKPEEDLNQLRERARANPGDNKLQLRLAKKLTVPGPDSRANIAEAQKIVRGLVAANDPDAMFYLADCMGQGTMGQVNDPKEAFTLYQSAGKIGHPGAAYRTAVCCEIGAEEGGGTRKDLQKALQWYKRAASLGDVPGAFKMGMISLKGLLGQEKAPTEAIKFLKQAADNADEENPHALHELGCLYETSNNEARVPKDEAYALDLFTKAAKLGYKHSQFKLGQAYEFGNLGCSVDARPSIVWYTRAAAQAEHQSELALSGWYLTGSEGILEHSDTEAYLWAKKAANSEPPLPKAMFAMGYYLEVGIGATRSVEEAKRWYGRAASYGFPKARERLDELTKGGARVAKNREKLSRSDPKRTEEGMELP